MNADTNGFICDYFSKSADFLKVTDEEVREMQDQLNGRPWQVFGWKIQRKPMQRYWIKRRKTHSPLETATPQDFAPSMVQ